MWVGHYELSEHEQKLVNMSREDYTNYMLAKYPNIFQEYHKPMTETCMCWGFDIEHGWYHVLDTLCGQLEAVYKETGVLCIFDQIKEKYGRACFYYHCQLVSPCPTSEDNYVDIWDKIIGVLVEHAESYCDYIDDELGTNCNPGDKLIIGGWYYGCTKEGYKKRIENSNDSDEFKKQELERLEKYGETRKTTCFI